jgi:hypothetical protein
LQFQFNKEVTCKRVQPCQPKAESENDEDADPDCPYKIVCPQQDTEKIEDFQHRIDESYEAQMYEQLKYLLILLGL